MDIIRWRDSHDRHMNRPTYRQTGRHTGRSLPETSGVGRDLLGSGGDINNYTDHSGAFRLRSGDVLNLIENLMNLTNLTNMMERNGHN